MANVQQSTTATAQGPIEHYDAVVIGAGVGGLYALHHLRAMGLSVRVYDGAAGVGGTWWWNRYPGARVDGPGSPFYCYTFSEELVREWDWAETQPDQPSVLYNMPLGAERESAWIGDCVRYLRERGLGAIEPIPDAEKRWDREVAELANATLYPLTDSWYTGANIPGKPRQFCVHLGGPLYFQRLSEVATQGYEGFVFEEERRTEVAAAS